MKPSSKNSPASSAPKNLLEQHYAEKIAAASWRMRRLHRWQAQLFEDAALPEDDILLKLDRVMRHENTLHRQIDTSVKMLGRELPRLFEGRVREDLLRRLGETERGLKDDPYLDQWLTEETRKRSALPTAPPALDPATLDTAPAQQRNCENEPAPDTLASHDMEEATVGATLCGCPPSDGGCPPSDGGRPPSDGGCQNEPEGVLTPASPHANCQNKPAPAPNHPLPPALADPEGGGELARQLGGVSGGGPERPGAHIGYNNPHVTLPTVAIDLDGTLLHSKTHRVSPGNAAAVERLREQGATVVLASGRQHETTAAFALEMRLPAASPVISYNGALVRLLTGKPSRTIPCPPTPPRSSPVSAPNTGTT